MNCWGNKVKTNNISVHFLHHSSEILIPALYDETESCITGSCAEVLCESVDHLHITLTNPCMLVALVFWQKALCSRFCVSHTTCRMHHRRKALTYYCAFCDASWRFAAVLNNLWLTLRIQCSITTLFHVKHLSQKMFESPSSVFWISTLRTTVRGHGLSTQIGVYLTFPANSCLGGLVHMNTSNLTKDCINNPKGLPVIHDLSSH